MIIDDATRFNILHALRIKGATAVGDLAAIGGAGEFEALDAEGLVVRKGAWIVLSRAGRESHAATLEEVVDDVAVTALGAIYDDAFLPLNKRFKSLCAQWQEPCADHFELLDDALSVHERIVRFLGDSATIAPGLGTYAPRFDALMAAVEDGDVHVYVAPVGASYHNVWFELHEDLIVTLRRSRAAEEAAADG